MKRKRKVKVALKNKVDEISPKIEEEEEIRGEVVEWRDWSSLLEPLLLSILNLLNTNLQDFFAFRGVCKNWRSLSIPTASILSSQSPLILGHCGKSRSYAMALYDITEKRVYKTLLPWGLRRSRRILSHSHGQLIASSHRDNQNLILCNLLTGSRTPLPKAPFPFWHAILSSPPSDPDCVVVLFSSHKIQYCRLGDQQWTEHSWKKEPVVVIRDMIFLDKKLYALTESGRLGAIDFLPHPELTLLGADNNAGVDMGIRDRWLLAESGGDLLVVCVRRPYWLNECEVWHWDFVRGGGFGKVSSLGGRALFIQGSKFAGSVSGVASGVRQNCIYHIDDWKNNWIVYSLDDGSVEDCSPASPDLAKAIPKEPPVWIFPSICW